MKIRDNRLKANKVKRPPSGLMKRLDLANKLLQFHYKNHGLSWKDDHYWKEYRKKKSLESREKKIRVSNNKRRNSITGSTHVA